MNPRTERAHAFRDRRTAAYLAEHGSPPACACGCGEPVRFNANGMPNQYVYQHQVSRNIEQGVATRSADHIPIEQFRKAMRNLQARSGMTWTEMATLAGVRPQALSSTMHNPRRRTVSREWVERLLGPLAAQQANARAEQLAKARKLVKIDRELENV